MREILFRGKRIDNSEWVEGFLVKHPSAMHIGDYSPWYISVPPKDPDDSGGLHNIIPETIGQFTGLTDKNGKKIFEGDVVKHYCEGTVYGITDIGIVFWDEKRCMFLRTSDDGKSTPQIWDICKYEVIGNIHDNP